MGIYTRPDSQYWWLYLETSKRKQRTNLLVKGSDPERTKLNRKLAEEIYHTEMARLAVEPYGLAEKPRIRFEEYADWYETHVVPRHRGADRERQILAALRRAFGKEWLHTLDRARIEEWMTARAAQSAKRHTNSTRPLRPIAPATVNRELDLLKRVLVSAVPKYLTESPAAGITRLSTPAHDPFRLTREAEARLLDALAPADRPLVLFALDTLARLSDVVNLERRYDHGAYVLLPRPKGKPYKVPISPRLRDALKAIPDDGTGFYFAHRRKAKNPRDFRSGIKDMLEAACRKADPKIPYGRGIGLTFHGLRHEGASRMLEAGHSPKVVQEIGGWKDFRAMQRYLHPTDKAKVQAVRAIGGAQPFPNRARRQKQKSQPTQDE